MYGICICFDYNKKSQGIFPWLRDDVDRYNKTTSGLIIIDKISRLGINKIFNESSYLIIISTGHHSYVELNLWAPPA